MLNYYTCSDVATKFLCNINITAELTVEHAHALLLLAPRPCLSERIRIWRQTRLAFIQTRSVGNVESTVPTDRKMLRPDKKRQTKLLNQDKTGESGEKDKQSFCTKEAVPP
jgi:hypothetical protein